jgi:hypothetical protein
MAVDREQFLAASEAAERWLGLVEVVADLGRMESLDPRPKCARGRPKHPNLDAAYTMLCEAPGNLQDEYRAHDSALREAFEELRVKSDAPVRWVDVCVEPGPRFSPPDWSSAHEAAHGIALLFLGALVYPLTNFTNAAKQRAQAKRLLTTRWKALAMRFEGVKALQERIRRERAKLCEQPVAEDPYLRAETPTQCAKRIKRGLDTLKRYINNRTVRCEKINDRLWRLHREDVRKFGGKLD